MPSDKHKLTNIIENEHGAGGVCTCGRWGGAGKDRKALKRLFAQHKREAK